MKASQVTLFIVIFLLILAGIYGYIQYSFPTVAPVVEVATSTATSTAKEPVPEEKILAKGDIDGDGSEDKVVEEMNCGASCSFNLAVFFNKDGKFVRMPEDSMNENFGPSYVGSSAVKSSLTDVAIYNKLITLTGQGLACSDPCTEEKWQKRKTVTYKYDGTKIVQVSIDFIESVNTPFEGDH